MVVKGPKLTLSHSFEFEKAPRFLASFEDPPPGLSHEN